MDNITNYSKPVKVSCYNEKLVLREDGTVWTWNSNTPPVVFSQVTGLTDIIDISTCSNHSLALKADGTVWAWGDNSYGQCGTADQAKSIRVPAQVQISDVMAISTGSNYSVALKKDGTVWAWGYNNGLLGDGTMQNRMTPVQVPVTDAIQICACGNHTLALCGDGTLWAWGGNNFGQLGNKTTNTSYSPVQASVADRLPPIKTITGGAGYTMILCEDHSVWGWGYNYYGTLGTGSKENTFTPVPAALPATVSALMSRNSTCFAMSEDGIVWAWGYNFYAQTGDIFRDNILTPKQIPNLSGFVALTTSNSYSVGIKEDGSIWWIGVSPLNGMPTIYLLDHPSKITVKVVEKLQSYGYDLERRDYQYYLMPGSAFHLDAVLHSNEYWYYTFYLNNAVITPQIDNTTIDIGKSCIDISSVEQDIDILFEISDQPNYCYLNIIERFADNSREDRITPFWGEVGGSGILPYTPSATPTGYNLILPEVDGVVVEIDKNRLRVSFMQDMDIIFLYVPVQTVTIIERYENGMFPEKTSLSVIEYGNSFTYTSSEQRDGYVLKSVYVPPEAGDATTSIDEKKVELLCIQQDITIVFNYSIVQILLRQWDRSDILSMEAFNNDKAILDMEFYKRSVRFHGNIILYADQWVHNGDTYQQCMDIFVEDGERVDLSAALQDLMALNMPVAAVNNFGSVFAETAFPPTVNVVVQATSINVEETK